MRKFIFFTTVLLLFTSLLSGQFPVNGSDDLLNPVEVMYDGLDLVLVIDCSGSMQYTDPKKNAKIAAEHIVNRIGNNSKLGFVFFGGNDEEEKEKIKFTPLVSVSSGANKIFLHNSIEQQYNQNRNYTNIPNALDKALTLFDDNSANNRAVILLTDGADDTNTTNITNLRMEVETKAKDLNIPIYPIGLSVNGSIPDEFKSILESFATETGADKVRSANSSQQIINYFDEIYNMLRKIMSDNDVIGPFDGNNWMPLPKTLPPYVVQTHIAITSDGEFEVRFKQPDETYLSEKDYKFEPRNDTNAISYYIDNPPEGDWIIEVKGKRGYFAEVEINIDNNLRLAMTVNGEDKNVVDVILGENDGDDIQFKVFFELYGQSVDKLEIYNEVENITLRITDKNTGGEQITKLSFESGDQITFKDGSYYVMLEALPVGEYNAVAEISHKYFKRESVPVTIIVSEIVTEQKVTTQSEQTNQPLHTSEEKILGEDEDFSWVWILLAVIAVVVIAAVILKNIRYGNKFLNDVDVELEITSGISSDIVQGKISAGMGSVSLDSLGFTNGVCNVVRNSLGEETDFNENKIAKYLRLIRIMPPESEDGDMCVKILEREESAAVVSFEHEFSFKNTREDDDDETRCTVRFVLRAINV